ncbi:DUF6371 domain-containing protein [Prevotella sp. E13-27]|uniref:DUF6371 domain-containing protein n=1 Tax=Prevotella sp. E13-27 TaxID=2938122 RepID=UPI00200A2BF8|nr:DUF6371 domain-containing protein [Prevotella sp. E13-27]MCK8623622.1 DUF6371 domain-containing protein [Prevotella sp. E13-27]
MCTPLDPNDPRYSMDFVMPSMKMISACRADDFDFFQPFIAAGKLTVEQMRHAAQRYHLGKTKSGQPMYWMIDDMLQPLDAHIGQDAWISQLLKKREPLLQYWQVHHCLFGLHLLTNTNLTNNTNKKFSNSPILDSEKKDSFDSFDSCSEEKPICVVECESSAVVLSELFPDSIWMAYCTVPHLDIQLFEPLQGRTVTIYPCTDPCMSNILFFEELCDSVRKHYDITLSVDRTLEDHATDAQKSRHIDLLDFLLESLADSADINDQLTSN